MKIVIKTTNIKLTKTLEKYLVEKLNSLEKFANIFQTEKYSDSSFGKEKPRIEAWVEVGKTTLHHRKGPYFWAECQIRFPKKSLRATSQREDLKLAISEVKDKLERELRQYKEKLISLTKKRTLAFKKEFHLSP